MMVLRQRHHQQQMNLPPICFYLRMSRHLWSAWPASADVFFSLRPNFFCSDLLLISLGVLQTFIDHLHHVPDASLLRQSGKQIHRQNGDRKGWQC